MSSSGWIPPEGDSSTGRAGLGLARTIAAPVLSLIRSRGRTVLWTPPNLGGGNHLYMWMHVWTLRQAGGQARMLSQPGMEQWVLEFPKLSELTVTREAVRFTDKRTMAWNQNFPDFEPGVLQGFVRTVLFDSTRFRERVDRARNALSANDIVINIRRGDYYSNPEYSARYGMDQAFLLTMVRDLLGDLSDVTVWTVSDEPEWSFRFVAEHLPGIRVRPFDRSGMFDDLAVMVAAPTLVLSNSTFSYWGGYMRTVEAGEPMRVLAPTFHFRQPDWGRAWHLDPSWTAVDNYPHEISRDPFGA